MNGLCLYQLAKRIHRPTPRTNITGHCQSNCLPYTVLKVWTILVKTPHSGNLTGTYLETSSLPARVHDAGKSTHYGGWSNHQPHLAVKPVDHTSGLSARYPTGAHGTGVTIISFYYYCWDVRPAPWERTHTDGEVLAARVYIWILVYE